MNTMHYKGYIGSIEVSEADNCLYGKVIDLPAGTAITFEGETVSDLRIDFENAVDDYLEYCKENNIQPRKSYSGTLNIRISPDTHCRLAMLAQRYGVTLNALIKSTLDKQVASLW